MTKIILLCVHNHGAANDRIGAAQSDQLVAEVNFGHPIGLGCHIAKVAVMADFILEMKKNFKKIYLEIKVKPITFLF